MLKKVNKKEIFWTAVVVIGVMIGLRLLDVSFNDIIPAKSEQEKTILALDTTKDDIDTALMKEFDKAIETFYIAKSNGADSKTIDSLTEVVNSYHTSSSNKSIFPRMMMAEEQYQQQKVLDDKSDFLNSPSGASNQDSSYWVSSEKVTFYIVTPLGFIIDRNDQVQCVMNNNRAYYEITLPYGIYRFITISKRDTVTFEVGDKGVFKKAWDENSKYLTILRDSLR
jgi:hypothetical protein